MHIKKEDMDVLVAEHRMNGKGSVSIRTFLPAEESYGTGRIFATFTLQPGCSIGYHKHEGEFEVYYITKGTATVVEDGETYTLKAGDMMQCKDGSSHSIENCTNEEMEFIGLILFNKQN